MKKISTLFICLIVSTCPMVGLTSDFQVGFAKTIITPGEEFLPINTGGYLGLQATGYRVDPSLPTGREELYARSMVLEWTDTSGETRLFALTILDAVGISNRIARNISSSVAAATGIAEVQQFVGATHTHTAPDLQGPWGGVPDEYKQYVETQTIQAVIDAHNSLVPAEVFVSTSVGTDRNHNRRNWGFADEDIVLLEFRQPGNGQTIGSVINFAAHPTSLGEVAFLSRDFCGSLVDHIEAHLDQNANDVAIFVNGIVGDVVPKLATDEDTHSYGERIAQAAIDSKAGGQDQVDPAMGSMQTIEWEVTITGFVHTLLYLAGRLDYDAHWENQRLRINTTLAYLRFGNTLEIVTFPGESLTRNGAAVKMNMAANHKVFLGLTGDALGYFVPSDEWRSWPFSCRNDCYEELLSPGESLGDEARNRLTGAM